MNKPKPHNEGKYRPLPPSTHEPVFPDENTPLCADQHVKKWSPKVEDCIVAWLEKGYSIGFAAQKAGVSRSLVNGRAGTHPEFGERYRNAIERGTDVLEDEARRRAVDGVQRPVFQGGECVGHVQEFSDNLMTILLGGRRDKYRRQKVEHSGEGGGPLKHVVEVEFVESDK